MWIKYSDRHPEIDGAYLIAIKQNGRLYYDVVEYTKDLKKRGWYCEDGNEGFFEQDPYDGSLYMVTPIAWAEFEEYKG